ncbi:MAG: hypothetical protein IJJ76_14270 [Ruminococcus sp.]|uniref:hypothetical protein n=1 Tax=Ruminococcus sp. TaxID=41978 RepID=UPI0025D2ACF7|nr:hypothetical protein [Ruminococcus sp.]MBR0530917.1 hypothetical protein [Ruminococcus sp.]
MKYLKLLDKLNQDEMVKEEPERSFYQYSFGEDKWLYTTIMSDCFFDTDKCGEYKEISEAEAIQTAL